MESTPNISKEPTNHLLVNEENLKRLMHEVHLLFPHLKHEHSPIVNVNDVADEKFTFGQKVADAVASGMGSWNFIIGQSTILVVWIILNSIALFIWKWDPYPFIALNLLLSCQAAYAAPIIMMSQNRQAQKDRLTAENDYKTDLRSAEQLIHVMDHLEHQDALVLQIVQRLELQNQHLDKQDGAILEIVQHIEQQNQQLGNLNTATLDIVQQVQAEHERLVTQRQEMMEQLSEVVPAKVAQVLNPPNDSSSEQSTNG